jgi:hypothetical protein
MATIGDLVLIYQEEEPASFARIEDISADAKSGWYQVRFLLLQVPVGEAVWILRESYIEGDTFTMNGIRTRIEKVRGGRELEEKCSPADTGTIEEGKTVSHKVISLFDRKKG